MMNVIIFNCVYLFITLTCVYASETNGRSEAVKTIFETIKRMKVHHRPKRENAKFMSDKVEMGEQKEPKEPTISITIDNINSSFLVKIMEAYVFLLGGIDEFDSSIYKKQKIGSEKSYMESMVKPESEKSMSKPEIEKSSKESVSKAEREKSSMSNTATEKSENPYWDEFWKVVEDAKNSAKRNSCCQTTLSPDCCQKETQEVLIKKLAILMDTGSPGPSMAGNFQPQPEDYVDYKDYENEDQRGDRKLNENEIESTTTPPESTEAGTLESTESSKLEV